MKCPFCNSDKIEVMATRSFDTVIKRAKICTECEQIFNTIETIELSTPIHLVTINNAPSTTTK